MKSSRPGPGNYGTNDAVHRINWARDGVGRAGQMWVMSRLLVCAC